MGKFKSNSITVGGDTDTSLVTYYYYDEDGYRRIITHTNQTGLKYEIHKDDFFKKKLKDHPQVRDHCFAQMDGKEFKVNLDFNY
ncbi:hypothetical protein ACWEWU_13930 [Staphylococcus xylosus]